MKIKVYDIRRLRYLSEYELEEQFFYTGEYIESIEGPYEEIEEFKVNLNTIKIQTNQDNACIDPDCCCPCERFADDDNFVIEVFYE